MSSEPDPGSEPDAESGTTPTASDAVAIAKRAMERVSAVETKYETLEAKLDAKNETIQELRDELARIEQRTNLLHLVEEADALDAKQRSAALLQHLKQAAERERTRGRKAKHSLNRDQADEALHYPDVDRTTIYTDMQRAARLVNDEDLVWYGEDDGGERRLFLDLKAADDSTALTEVL